MIFKFFFPALLSILALSCGTVDVERKVSDSGFAPREGAREDGGRAFTLEPEVVVIERPVYVPAAEAPPRTPAAGTDSVRAANSSGVIRPQDFSHAAMVYDYDPDFVYEVYTQPLRVTDLCLQPQERAVEAPFISDSERWVIGAGTSYENGSAVQHIYVKPASQGLEATLIINTDRRVYRIILRSFSNVHMPVVRWRYPAAVPDGFWQPPQAARQPGGQDGAPSHASVDPRFLSFNYRITYGLFSKPYWLPELVFDDGSKTYIAFPAQVLQREMPAVFENRRDIVNYRVSGNMVIIDKLVENLTVRVGRCESTISKKRG